MGTFSIWHWLIVLIVALFMFGLPVLAVARENSELRTSRREFLLWIIAFIGIQVIIWFIGELLDEGDIAQLIGGIFALAIIYPYYQRYVRRARDAGMGKMIAYLSIIPIISFVTTLILLFKGTKAFSIKLEEPQDQPVGKIVKRDAPIKQIVDLERKQKAQPSQNKFTPQQDSPHQNNTEGNKDTSTETVLESEDWKVLLEYDPAVESGWLLIRDLPLEYIEDWAKIILSSPLDQRDVKKAVSKIRGKFKKDTKISSQDKINELYGLFLKHNDAAAQEFKKAVELIGENLNIESTTEKIRAKYEIAQLPGDCDYKGYVIRVTDSMKFQVLDVIGKTLSKELSSEATAKDFIARLVRDKG